MTRKSVKSNDGTSQSETRDYMRLKTLTEEFIKSGCSDYDEGLDDVLIDISKTGIVRMPWKLLKPLMLYKMDKCLSESFDSTKTEQDMEKKLKEMMDTFEGPPFTVQRLCELLLDPLRHYKRKDRYMRALEKNLLVISTQEPDLVWMKVPKLSQLLELKSKPTIEDTAAVIQPPETMLVVKEPAMMRRTPPLRDTPPGSPAQILQRLSPRSLTPPPDIDQSARNLDGFVMDSRLSHEPSYFSRKRSSSFRSNGSGSVSGQEVELQEADSTVSDPLMSHDLTNKKTCSDESEEAIIIGELLSRVGGTPKGQSSKPTEEVEIDKSKEEEEEEGEGSHESHVTVGSTPPTETDEGQTSHSVAEEMEVN
ncbi:PREDICTED: serine/threonine-protein phosphatase 4 regulatory subunit 2-B-like [Amphimedon queenslandica]|uniref:Uncharacterized protein n=1 Tax=Amphimedon queenslandica TaxID=400682 RepID=A0A1X7UPF6_AMPQE|nr:PREDICTED: serine/threonine-protein phosphatase 4 regulatory subunit 2-B-like [Amphimedon queenslandica]|eukprot:XP_003387174.2 PREDICTED: serine/threonine-protein phosphatase 4 regulatory subunit 2-B-like [Amphimedon queenslandica]